MKYGLVAIVGKAHYQLLDVSERHNGVFFNNKEDSDDAKHSIYNDMNSLALKENYKCKVAFTGSTVRYVNGEAFIDYSSWDVLNIRIFDKVYTNKERPVDLDNLLEMATKVQK